MYNFTLLITEDISSNYTYLESAIGRNFNKVLHANNGLEAVEFCRSDSGIGLVLMDISMPEMNGFEATKIIRSIRPDLVVLALTAYIVDDLEEKLFQAGCSGYLLKPFLYKDLMAEIALHLDVSHEMPNTLCL